MRILKVMAIVCSFLGCLFSYAESLDRLTQKRQILSDEDYKELKKNLKNCLKKKTTACVEQLFEIPFKLDWTTSDKRDADPEKCDPPDYKNARKAQEIINCLKFEGSAELIESCVNSKLRIISEGRGVLAVFGEMGTCRFRNKSNGWRMYEVIGRP